MADKPVQGSSVNNQDLPAAEDPTSGISQQLAFTSPSSVPPTPVHRSTAESSSGPLSFPGTAPVLGASSADSQQETDSKRFKGS